MSELIYHLAEPEDWPPKSDSYRAPSLADDGFIHCSTPAQVNAVARDLFAGHNDLTLLEIDPSHLGTSRLVYEDLYELDELFPHVYGPLPLAAVVGAKPYLRHVEEDLWRRETRFDPAWMERILHPDFEEFGASGRHHRRAATIAVVDSTFELMAPLIEYRLDLVTADAALARYHTRVSYGGVEETALRSSLWVHTGTGWRLRFHQGTPVSRAGRVSGRVAGLQPPG